MEISRNSSLSSELISEKYFLKHNKRCITNLETRAFTKSLLLLHKTLKLVVYTGFIRGLGGMMNV